MSIITVGTTSSKSYDAVIGDMLEEIHKLIESVNVLEEDSEALKIKVGGIYISTVNKAPSYGTWVAWGSGRVPVGIDTEQTEFDTIEKEGGAKTHTLTTAQMPSHNHYTSGKGGGFAGSSGTFMFGLYANGTTLGSDIFANNNTGGGEAHNNLQPYVTCYMFKRTA